MQIFFVLMYKICAFQEKYRLCSPEIQADCTYGNKMLRFYPKSAHFLDIHSRFFCIWKMRVLYGPVWRKIPHFPIKIVYQRRFYFHMYKLCLPSIAKDRVCPWQWRAAAVIPEAAPDPLPPFRFRRCRTVLPARPPRRGLRRPAGWGRGGYFSRPGAGGPAAR